MEELSSTSTSRTELIGRQTSGIQGLHQRPDELQQLVSEIAERSESLARFAGESSSSMQEVGQAVESNSDAMARIQEAFARVHEITAVMTEIADKTNLLALNASIEAARAGDAGRGFAVVADEVGKLADFAGENTRNISAIVGESLANVEQAGSPDIRAR